MAETVTTIDKFLGLHMDSTDGLNIEVGELATLKNIRITENYKLRKREGYSKTISEWSSDSLPYKNLPVEAGYSYYIIHHFENTLIYITYLKAAGYEINTGMSGSTSTFYYVSSTNSAISYKLVNGAWAERTSYTTGQTAIYNTAYQSNFNFYDKNGVLKFSANDYNTYPKISGMWYGKLGSTYHFVFTRNGHVYKGNLSNGTLTDLGLLTYATTNFFAFNDKLYIQNGTEYKYWTGTGSIADVAGYIPKVAIATPPAGGGTPYEGINLLTGKKHQTFKGDGSATVYQLAEKDIDSVEYVKVWELVAGDYQWVTKTVTTHYTIDKTAGTITFVTAPADYTDEPLDNVDIYWTKGSGTRATVTGNKQAVLFGGANDSRVFMYGVGNKIIHSGLADGMPSAEYFPETNYLIVGSDEYDVTHLSKQYDRLIVHTEKDSHYCIYEWDATLGVSILTYPLNDSIGNVAFGQGRNILNNPFVITSNGVFQFTATNVRDEKNAVFTSQRVQPGLDGLDLTTAITFDWEKNYEYWLAVGTKVYVYNYKLDVWYYFELATAPSCFLEINGEAYFGTSLGQVMKFDADSLSDNGTAISSRWETGYMSFGANYIRKFLNFGWIGLQPQGRSKCIVSWESDNSESSTTYSMEYNLLDFGNINFADFSFQTSDSPKPFRLKLKCKKFTYFKLIGVNEELTKDMCILNITMPVTFGGMAK